MTDADAVVEMSARAIAAAVRGGELGAVEVTTALIDGLAERDGDVHAFLTLTPDAALAEAAAVDARIADGEDPGPLAGVPVALKDNLCTRGVPTTCASRILQGWKPPYDATVVDRLRAAGAVSVGKTNLDEFAMGSSTEHSAFGPTRNPRDLTRVPGGSSGGSAAAVAADFVPVSVGSDTGGSIRQPAAFCGVVGVKPTYGTVSRHGLIAFASSLDQIGPFARDVADAALMLETIAGHDPLDSTSIAKPFPRIGDHLSDGVEGLRVGVVTDLLGDGIAPDIAARMRTAATALGDAGARVVDVSMPSLRFALSAYYLIAPAEASSNLARFDGVRYGRRVDAPTTDEMMIATRTAGFGAEVKRRIMLGTYALSAGYYDAYYGSAQKVRTVMCTEFADTYRDVDVLISPTTPTTAFGFGEQTGDPMTMYLNDACTAASNLVGHPAMSVPFGTDSGGLPVGLQVMAPALGEVAMFRTAAVVERAATESETS